MASYNNIKVVARFRPQNKIELANGGEAIVHFDSEETCSIKVLYTGSIRPNRIAVADLVIRVRRPLGLSPLIASLT
jgi:hypothetical protein